VRFYTHKTNSINIFPEACLYSVVDGSARSPPFNVVERVLEIGIFGFLFQISWNSNVKRDVRTLLPPFGPAFSRKKKTWRWD
jgi:hypothetical protein